MYPSHVEMIVREWHSLYWGLPLGPCQIWALGALGTIGPLILGPLISPATGVRNYFIFCGDWGTVRLG